MTARCQGRDYLSIGSGSLIGSGLRLLGGMEHPAHVSRVRTASMVARSHNSYLQVSDIFSVPHPERQLSVEPRYDLLIVRLVLGRDEPVSDQKVDHDHGAAWFELSVTQGRLDLLDVHQAEFFNVSLHGPEHNILPHRQVVYIQDTWVHQPHLTAGLLVRHIEPRDRPRRDSLASHHVGRQSRLLPRLPDNALQRGLAPRDAARHSLVEHAGVCRFGRAPARNPESDAFSFSFSLTGPHVHGHVGTSADNAEEAEGRALDPHVEACAHDGELLRRRRRSLAEPGKDVSLPGPVDQVLQGEIATLSPILLRWVLVADEKREHADLFARGRREAEAGAPWHARHDRVDQEAMGLGIVRQEEEP